MVKLQPSKLVMRVRFSLLAPLYKGATKHSRKKLSSVLAVHEPAAAAAVVVNGVG